MWDQRSLLKKATEFFARAETDDDPDNEQAPLWSILGLELVARAVLAHKNPALVADPAHPPSLLFACGLGAPKESPKSRHAADVAVICGQIIPEFAKEEQEQFRRLLDARNAFLHSGSQSLSTMRASDWQPQLFRLSEILLRGQGERLSSILSKDTVKAAEKMISALADDRKKAVRALVDAAAESFKALPIDERLQKVKEAIALKLYPSGFPFGRSRAEKCPACDARAFIVGELVRCSRPRDVDGQLQQEEVYLPVKILCFACGLDVEGHENLHALGFGGTFKITTEVDPTHYMAQEPDYDSDDYR